jgi:hypothetical protein
MPSHLHAHVVASRPTARLVLAGRFDACYKFQYCLLRSEQLILEKRADKVDLIILINVISGYIDDWLVVQIVFAAWSYTSSCVR